MGTGSIFCHVSYLPMPIIAFRLLNKYLYSEPNLGATGSVLGVGTTRFVLKKLELTGHISKVNKNRALIRNLFIYSEDVEHFRLLDVYSKCGRRGRILKSVGTTGSMKVIFDLSPIQSNAVFVSLYKRVFPNWPLF